MRGRTVGVGVLLLAVAVFFTNLGGARLWDRDEPRNAGCTAEMLARGDWIVPVFNGELRPHKPVLLYWFMMASYAVFGVNEFAARAVSALLSVGTVMITVATGRRLLGPGVGLWSGAILATSTMFCLTARAATPDATLTFFCTLALGLFVHFVFPCPHAELLANRPSASLHWPFPDSWWQGAALYGSMAVATLAKGPVGLVLPTAVIGLFCLWARMPSSCHTREDATWSKRISRTLALFAPVHFIKTCWAMRPLTALGLTALIAGPWYMWVGIRTNGDWLIGFLGEHNLGRALTPMEGHGGPFYYYLVAILIGMFPWSIVALPTALHNWHAMNSTPAKRDAIRFLLCWSGVYCGLFTIARTKLPSYVIPAYPALAILVAHLVHDLALRVEQVRKYWIPIGWSILTLVGALGIGALWIASDRYLQGDRLVLLVAAIPLLGGIVGGITWLLPARRISLATLLLTASMQAITLFGWLSGHVSENRTDLELLAALQTSSPEHTLVTYQRLEPSWVFYAGHPIRAFDESNFSELQSYLRDEPTACVITTEDGAEQLRQRIPVVWRQIGAASYFLRDDRLVAMVPQWANVASAPRRESTQTPNDLAVVRSNK